MQWHQSKSCFYLECDQIADNILFLVLHVSPLCYFVFLGRQSRRPSESSCWLLCSTGSVVWTDSDVWFWTLPAARLLSPALAASVCFPLSANRSSCFSSWVLLLKLTQSQQWTLSASQSDCRVIMVTRRYTFSEDKFLGNI